MPRREREFEWRPGRFKDVVLYIAEQLRDDPTFGSTKLNKILYFSDMQAFLRLGEPITGAVYQRNHYGPTAVEYEPMVGELEEQNYARLDVRHIHGYKQEVVEPTGEVEPNMDQLNDEQKAILDAVIEEFRGYTNTESSDESHRRSAGWLTRKQGETIPYISALIDPEPPDEFVIAGLLTKTPV